MIRKDIAVDRCWIIIESGTFILKDTANPGGLEIIYEPIEGDKILVDEYFWDSDDNEFWDGFNAMTEDEKEEFFYEILNKAVEDFFERRRDA